MKKQLILEKNKKTEFGWETDFLRQSFPFPAGIQNLKEI